MKFAVFNNQTDYDNWHTVQKTNQGLTDSNSPYAYTLTHLVDPVANPQVLARIDSAADITGLTIWDEVTAFLNGFLYGLHFVENRIKKRQIFWNNLVTEFAANNRLQGITAEQSNHVINRLLNIITMGQVGALETALSELQNNFLPDDFSQTYHWITQAHIDDHITKIQDYLNGETWS